jgi:peroxiredoxin
VARFTPWLIAAVVISALLGGCCTTIPINQDFSDYAPTLAPPLRPQEPDVGTSVGCLAPDFQLTSLNGTQIKLSDYRSHLVLLNFWTYCDACKAELPYIQRVFNEREVLAQDLHVVAVNVSQPLEQVTQFVSYYGYNFEFLLDVWATVASEYYLQEIPTTFFIDRNGIIGDVFVGEFSGPEIIGKKVSALTSR